MLLLRTGNRKITVYIYLQVGNGQFLAQRQSGASGPVIPAPFPA